MSVSTTRPAHMSSVRIPVLKPLHAVHLESFRADVDGTYRCGSNAASQFCLAYAGAEFTHCSFIRKAGSFSVIRKDGRVWVNDLLASGLTQLTEGDVISLGPVSYRLEFQDSEACPPERHDRSTQMTAQWNELAVKMEELAEQERENVRRSLEMDSRHQALADQQRRMSEAAEKNSRILAEVEAKREELKHRESEIKSRAADVHRFVRQIKRDRLTCRETNRTAPSADEVRSELASLFGLEKRAVENVTPPPLSPAACVEQSETQGKYPPAVLFGSCSAPLTETESTGADVGDTEASREKTSDDFVRDYMEQLLSRNRKSNGIAQPVEPKAADRKKDQTAASADKAAEGRLPKSPPQVKSYIEQYMAENMGNMDDSKPITMPGPSIEASEIAAFDEERPVQACPKIDRLKLKEHMASFRTLSAQSVENALASHAIDVQRLSFSQRTVIAALLILSSVVLGIANVCGVIDAPMLIWVTLISAIAIFFQLFQQYRTIAVHTRNPLDLLFTSARAKKYIKQSTRPAASTSVMPDSASDLEMSVHDESKVHARRFGRSESLPAGILVSPRCHLDH